MDMKSCNEKLTPGTAENGRDADTDEPSRYKSDELPDVTRLHPRLGIVR